MGCTLRLLHKLGCFSAATTSNLWGLRALIRFVILASRIFREASINWLRNRGPRLGAALAFYSALAIAPLLVITITLGSLVFGESATRDRLITQAEEMVGKDGARAIDLMLTSADKSRGIIPGVLGIAALILGASGVFGELQDAMDTIWHVRPTKAMGLGTYLRNRCLSFAMVLGTGFLLLVSLLASAAVSAAADTLNHYWPGWEPVWVLSHTCVSFGVVTVLFAMIFKVLPDAKIPWRDVWFGALLTSCLFSFGKMLIGVYIGKSGLATAYGAAGSVVVLLVWVYYSAQILFFGAELTRVFTRHNEGQIESDDGATFVKQPTEVRVPDRVGLNDPQ